MQLSIDNDELSVILDALEYYVAYNDEEAEQSYGYKATYQGEASRASNAFDTLLKQQSKNRS